jgi:hypothetical protein
MMGIPDGGCQNVNALLGEKLFNPELREILNGGYVRIKQKFTTVITESPYSI